MGTDVRDRGTKVFVAKGVSTLENSLVRRGMRPGEKEEIVARYKDPQFPGAFSGAKNFYESLKKDAEFPAVSYQDVLKTLSEIPSYSLHVRRHKLRFYRHVDYEKLSVGVDMQADLAEFPETAAGTKYAFVMIDVMDNYCYAKEMPDKTARSVQAAFLSLKKASFGHNRDSRDRPGWRI